MRQVIASLLVWVSSFAGIGRTKWSLSILLLYSSMIVECGLLSAIQLSFQTGKSLWIRQQFGILVSQFREGSLPWFGWGERISLERDNVISSGLSWGVVCLSHQEGENSIDDNLLVGITSHKKWKRSKRQIKWLTFALP